MWCGNNNGINTCVTKLEAVQSLIKFAQNRECFICDFVVEVKLIQVDIYNFYVDLERHFSYE
jgi:hypothetical protein